jgi:nitrate/TMAO reductase-like tetraheme cytochrome c subunit
MPQHIKRLITAFILVFVLFLAMQQVLKPSSFGKLGHYRADAIPENEMKPLQYAGSARCTKCHEDMATDKAIGFHAQPGLKHAQYADKFKDGKLPDSLMLHKPDERKECAKCHQLNAARIKITFDTINNTMIHQVNTLKHNPVNKKTNEALKCIECHNPHQP